MLFLFDDEFERNRKQYRDHQCARHAQHARFVRAGHIFQPAHHHRADHSTEIAEAIDEGNAARGSRTREKT